jgi:hypothetical protein
VLPTLISALLGAEDTVRWRLRFREENRDTIIVFIGQASGMFHLAECAMLTPVPIRHFPAPPGSPQAVLQHFVISPSPFYQNVRKNRACNATILSLIIVLNKFSL